MTAVAVLLSATAAALALGQVGSRGRRRVLGRLTGQIRRRPELTSGSGDHRVGVGLASVVFVVTLPILGVLGAAGAGGVVLLVRRYRMSAAERKQRQRVEREVPDTIELIVLGLRAGLTTRQALHFLAANADGCVRHGFEEAVSRLARGEPPPDALGALPEVLGTTMQPVVDLIGPADRYGLPLAPALEQLAHEARRTRQRLDEADARRLPIRLSFPLVVCTLPSFVLLAVAPAVLAALSSLGGTTW